MSYSADPTSYLTELNTHLIRTMTTTNQGMRFVEIEQIVAQRVANAIETIAIYETKTRMTRESMCQTKHQKDKLVENASNKRKWEGDHNGIPSQHQSKEHKCTNCKRVGHKTRDCRNPTTAKNQRTRTCFKCGKQGHYRSECLELKNRNLRNKSNIMAWNANA
ncbi:reverse transcriptase domain-containing protein [Tanacetum coccineum]